MNSLRGAVRLVAGMVAAVLLLTALIVGVALDALHKADRTTALARELNREAEGLLLLSAEPVVTPRLRAQWAAAVANVGTLAGGLRVDAEHQHLIRLLDRQMAIGDGLFRSMAGVRYTPAQRRTLAPNLTGAIQNVVGVALSLRYQAQASRDRAMARIEGTLGVAAAALLLVVSAAAMLVQRMVARPVADLTEAARAMGAGHLDSRAPPARTEEFQVLADALNQMAGDLSSTTVSRDSLMVEVEERRRAEERALAANVQLREAQDRLVQVEKLSALGTLVGGVAHEINNPLMGLTSYVSYAQEHMEEGRPREMLGRALREIDRIGRIVRNMLVFARATPTRSGDRVELGAVVAKTLALVEADLRKSGVQVKVDVPEPGPAAHCSEDSLQQALLNLVLNARDALAGREGGGRVTVSLAPADNRTVGLVIGDDGPGVPEELAGRIFDPFFTTKAPGKGTGLGLAVSRQLIEAAGGTITLGRAPEGGAAFTIRLKTIAEGVPA